MLGRHASDRCSGSKVFSRTLAKWANCKPIVAASSSLFSKSPGFPILSPASERVIESGRFWMNLSMPSSGNARRSDQ